MTRHNGKSSSALVHLFLIIAVLGAILAGIRADLAHNWRGWWLLLAGIRLSDEKQAGLRKLIFVALVSIFVSSVPEHLDLRMGVDQIATINLIGMVVHCSLS